MENYVKHKNLINNIEIRIMHIKALVSSYKRDMYETI